MATLALGNLTLVEQAKRKDPDGKVAKIVELLSQKNEILQDMTWKEGNLDTGHRSTVRTGLPTVYWKLLNEGIQPSKSTTAQITETCGMLEGWSNIDYDLANLGGNPAAYRASEGMAYLEALNQEMAQTLFYGNSGLDPKEFNGLSPRYSSLSANNAQNIVVGGGSGSDNTSIWLVCWSDETIFGVFPKGSTAGIEHKDYGVQVDSSTNAVAGAHSTMYKEQWKWHAGVVLKDWRYVVRAPNIDVSNLAGGSAADLRTLMVKMTHRIPNLKMGKCAFYLNRTVAQYLDLQRIDSVETGGGIQYSNVDGMPFYTFRGIPVRICDAILETEALVA